MFADVFTKLEPEDTTPILERINPLIDGTHYDPENATVMAIDLLFYHGNYRIPENTSCFKTT